jgi:SAM-dependent methyltransferase
MAEKPSIHHPNRQAFNWLAYELMDAFLSAHTENFRGCLYDLGCGEQVYREWLLRYADSYVGVDWSATQHQLKADVIADLNQPLEIEDGVADSIVSLSVMEHLCEPLTFLTEAFRILKHGGVLTLQVPFMWWVHEAPNDYFRYTRYGLEYLLKKAGFVEVEVVPQSGFWVMWTLKFNYQTTRLIRGRRPVRWLVSRALRVVWAIDQKIAPILDRRWDCDGETSGYFVVAKKA